MASGYSPLTRRFLLVNRGDTNNRNGYRIINKRVVHYSGPWEVNFPGGVLPAASNWLLIKDLPPTGAIGIVGVLETETRLGSVHARHAARQPEVQHSVRPLIAKHQLHAMAEKYRRSETWVRKQIYYLIYYLLIYGNFFCFSLTIEESVLRLRTSC